MFGGRESNQVPSGKKLTAAQTCTVYKLAQVRHQQKWVLVCFMWCLQEALSPFSCIALTECFCNGDGGVFCDVRAEFYILIFFPMAQQPPSGSRPPHYRGFTITLRHTILGRTPLDERSARCRDLQLTTHNTHKRQISMPPVGFEPAAAVPRLRPRGHWDRRVLALWKLNLCSNGQTRFWFSNLISCLTQPVPSFAKYNNLNTLYM